jgi:hypothetical protein
LAGIGAGVNVCSGQGRAVGNIGEWLGGCHLAVLPWPPPLLEPSRCASTAARTTPRATPRRHSPSPTVAPALAPRAAVLHHPRAYGRLAPFPLALRSLAGFQSVQPPQSPSISFDFISVVLCISFGFFFLHALDRFSWHGEVSFRFNDSTCLACSICIHFLLSQSALVKEPVTFFQSKCFTGKIMYCICIFSVPEIIHNSSINWWTKYINHMENIWQRITQNMHEFSKL